MSDHDEDGKLSMHDGNKYWYRGEKLHRVTGPAIELKNGNKFWFFNGVQHRVGGPAVERPAPHGVNEWWLNGVRQPDPAQ